MCFLSVCVCLSENVSWHQTLACSTVGAGIEYSISVVAGILCLRQDAALAAV